MLVRAYAMPFAICIQIRSSFLLQIGAFLSTTPESVFFAVNRSHETETRA